ncbi:hypothetical protein AALB64_04920 [Lachnospiraceae bacterium 45-P1]
MGRRSNKTGLKGIAAVAMLSLIFSADAAAALNDAPLSGMIDGSNAAPSVEADPDAATSSTEKKKEDEDFPAVTEEKKDVISRTMTEKSAVSVRYPIAAGTEGSPFDFFLDPCGLIEGTEAMRYGEGRVEEGATLLFYNRNGEYDFSKESDKLTVLTLEPVELRYPHTSANWGSLRLWRTGIFQEAISAGCIWPLWMTGEMNSRCRRTVRPSSVCLWNPAVIRLD